MSELDLTEAIEAGVHAAQGDLGAGSRLVAAIYAEAGIRAAAPLIERAALEAAAERIEAAVLTGSTVPTWAQPGGKPTASGIRAWAAGIVRGRASE